MAGYVPPEFEKPSFTCAVCGAVAQHRWAFKVLYIPQQGAGTLPLNFSRCACVACEAVSLWDDATRSQVHPRIVKAPMPHHDFPEGIKKDFLEARSIADESPRAAAALLRLCVQKLMPLIGGKGQNINDDIGVLVANGLPEQVKHALDICRVIGNNAVHPGAIDVGEDATLVPELFSLVNFIVEETIARKNRIEALMNKLPAGARDAIAKRDAKVLNAAQPLGDG